MTANEIGNLALAVHRIEEGSMERLVGTYQDQLYSFAVRLLRNSFDAQEVTQDAFLNAHRALTTRYDTEVCRTLALRPWLFRIAHNLAHTRLRARLTLKLEPLPPDERLLGEGRILRTNPELEFQKNGRRRSLDEALAQLKPGARELIGLRFFEELSFAEISQITGVGEAAARGKVFRALRDLRKIMTVAGGQNEL